MIWIGAANRGVPFDLGRIFSVRFAATAATDVTGLVSAHSEGFDVPPFWMDARLDHFIDTQCEGGAISHQSALAASPELPNLDVVPFGLPVFHGQTRIQYEYFPTSDLTEGLKNGDFEAPKLDPWSVDGLGDGDVFASDACKQATRNQLLELISAPKRPVSMAMPSAARSRQNAW